MLPKLRHRHRELEASSDDEYERVSVRDIQLVDPCPPARIVAPETPSLAAMAVELEETVLELTRPRRAPAPPARPTVAWIATIFSASTVMSLTATLILRGGVAPGPEAHAGAAAAGAGSDRDAPISAPALEEPASVPEFAMPIASEVAIAEATTSETTTPEATTPEATTPEATTPEATPSAVEPLAIPVAALPAAPPAARVVARKREAVAVAIGTPPMAVVAVDSAEPAPAAEPADAP